MSRSETKQLEQKTNIKRCNEEFFNQNLNLKSKRLCLIKRFSSLKSLLRIIWRKRSNFSKTSKNKNRNSLILYEMEVQNLTFKLSIFKRRMKFFLNRFLKKKLKFKNLPSWNYLKLNKSKILKRNLKKDQNLHQSQFKNYNLKILIWNVNLNKSSCLLTHNTKLKLTL